MCSADIQKWPRCLSIVRQSKYLKINLHSFPSSREPATVVIRKGVFDFIFQCFIFQDNLSTFFFLSVHFHCFLSFNISYRHLWITITMNITMSLNWSKDMTRLLTRKTLVSCRLFCCMSTVSRPLAACSLPVLSASLSLSWLVAHHTGNGAVLLLSVIIRITSAVLRLQR